MCKENIQKKFSVGLLLAHPVYKGFDEDVLLLFEK
jgi:hypothetical protein